MYNNRNPIPNQASAIFLLTGHVVSKASCTAPDSSRTPLSSLSCSPHCCRTLGVPDQLVTDLVTSAPLELLHLLTAEDR